MLAWQEMALAAAGEPTDLREYRGCKWVTNDAQPWDCALAVDVEFECYIIDIKGGGNWLGITMRWKENKITWTWSIWTVHVPKAWDKDEKWSDAAERLYTDIERWRATPGDNAISVCGGWNVDIKERDKKATDWKWSWLDERQNKAGLAWATPPTGERVQDICG